MDSTDLAFVVAVVEEGGVTAAARRLNCVQSNVTARIRALEAELGVALFHRTGRGVQPTRAAESLLPHARRTAAALADARGLPVMGVCSLDAVGAGARSTTPGWRSPTSRPSSPAWAPVPSPACGSAS